MSLPPASTPPGPARAPPTATRSRWPAWADALVVLAAGGLHALAFAPQDAPWLQTLAVAVLAWRVAAQASVRSAAWLGGLFSLTWMLCGVAWLYISLHRYGGLPAWMAALAVLALCAVLSIYLGLAMAAWVHVRGPRAPTGLRAAALASLAFAAAWLLAELARGLLFTGFPWLASGYAHSDGALAALAPWVGVYGMGAVSALSAALLAAGAVACFQPGPAAQASAERRRGLILVMTALALWWGPGLAARMAPGAFDFSTASGSLRVALLQTQVPQNEKFATEHQPEALAWTLRAMVEADADLIVAPETAIPLLPEQLPPDFWDALGARFAQGARTALIGLPLGSFAQGYTNSAAGLSADTRALPGGFYRYDKHHLVPFGEFIPWGFRWFVDLMQMPLGNFTRGPLVAPSLAVRGAGSVERVAPNICYEDLFGEELAARFADPATAPTILANLSNIAWFGESVAIDQHLQISRLRTLELQRPMIRATNTGATAVIDHRGKVTRWIAPHTRGVLEGTVQGRDGVTPYAAWAGRYGLGPLAAAAGVLLIAVRLRRRSSS